MDLKNLEVKDDIRGSLVEAYKLPSDGQVFYVISNPGETRGNHYHLRKTESFVVIYGSATISVRNRETHDLMKVEVSGFKPMKVTISPNYTHNITAGEDGAIIIAWVDELYDENDPDTIAEEI